MKKISFHKTSRLFNASRQFASYSLLVLIMLSAMSCGKDDTTPFSWGSPSGQIEKNNKNMYFSINYLGNKYYSYGQLSRSSTVGFESSPSLVSSNRVDSMGETFTDITINVKQLESSGNLSNRLGYVQTYIQLTKKGKGVIGLYTTTLIISDTIYRPYGLAISDTIDNFINREYNLIDTSGLEFNILKEGISDTDGAFVEGVFQLNLYGKANTATKIPVSGNFKLFRY